MGASQWNNNQHSIKKDTRVMSRMQLKEQGTNMNQDMTKQETEG